MQILSRALLVVGLIVVVVALVYLGMNVISINQLHAVAYANKSNDGPNPVNNVMWMTGLAIVGGFLAGLGLSMPRR